MTLLILAALVIGAAIGTILGGSCSRSKLRDAYESGYAAGFADGNPFAPVIRSIKTLNARIADVRAKYDHGPSPSGESAPVPGEVAGPVYPLGRRACCSPTTGGRDDE